MKSIPLLSNSKHQYRRPKQDRSKDKFDRVLDYATTQIEAGHLETFTLPEIVDGLGISGGALYYFFPSKEALLVALTDRALREFTDLIGTIDRRRVKSWRDVIVQASRNGRDHHVRTPSIMMLTLGPGYVWQVRLADTAGNARVATSLASALSEIFDFSFLDRSRLEELLLDFITMQDAFWRRSFEKHGTITDDYLQRGLDAGLAYLQLYIPENLRLSKTPNERARPAVR